MPRGRPARWIAVALTALPVALAACTAPGSRGEVPRWAMAPPDEQAVAYGSSAAQVLDVYLPPAATPTTTSAPSTPSAPSRWSMPSHLSTPSHLSMPSPPTPPLATLVYVHGGSFVGGWREQVALANPEVLGLTALGFAVVSIDYDLLPDPGGILGQVADVRRAVAWVRAGGAQHGLDPTTVVVMGQSAGGTLAALSAAGPDGPDRPDAWVAIAGVADIAGWAAANGVSVPTLEPLAAVSPLSAASRPAVPGYVIHATADPFVPVAQARALVEAGRRSGGSVGFDEVTRTPTCHAHSATCGMDVARFVGWLSTITPGPSVPRSPA